MNNFERIKEYIKEKYEAGYEKLYIEYILEKIITLEENYNDEQEIDRLNNNWNELEEYLLKDMNRIKELYSQINGNYGLMNIRLEVYQDILDKIKELRGNSNVED